jgi:Glycosyltransferase family 87
LTVRAGSYESASKSYRPFVVAGCAFLLIIQVAYFSMAYPRAVRGRADFCMLYTAGFMVRTGHAAELYDYESNAKFQSQVVSSAHGAMPFNHLAYEAFIFSPLSLLTYAAAYKTFLAINLGLMFFSFQMLFRFLNRLRDIWCCLPAMGFLCFLPAGIALFQGQDSLLLLTLLVCSFVAMNADHDYRAGIFMGLTLFKFQFGIPIALLYLAWRKWRVVSAFAATSIIAVVTSFALTGFNGFLTYPAYLLSMSSGLTSSGAQLRYGTYPLAMPNIFGLLFAIAGNHTVLTAIISCFVIMWAARRPPSFPLAVAVAMLVSYHGLIHDATILIIPILLFAEAGLRTSPPSWRRVWALAATLAYPAIAAAMTLPFCLLAVPVFGLLQGDETTRRRVPDVAG